MSGLGNQSFNESPNPNRVWLFIKEGKIIRKEANGPVAFDHLTGVLKDMFVKYDGMYGPELHVTLRAEGIDYTLQMRLDSGYSRSFMKIAPNFDLAVEMTLIPSIKYKEYGHPETGLFIRQSGKALKWYYTKDNPNGLPQMVACKIKNDKGHLVDGWDNTAQLKFLVEQIMVIKEMLPPPSVIENKENIAAVNGAGGQSSTSNTTSTADDLPF